MLNTTLSASLLKGLCWSCARARYPDRAAFSAAVRQYQLDILGSDAAWVPDRVVLGLPTVEIAFEHWIGDQQLISVFKLHAEDGQRFTMLELFHGVCDGIGRILEESGGELWDHHFFEGMVLTQQTPVPRFEVWFGS